MKLDRETQETLRLLKLQDIPREWVDCVWDENFCGEAVRLPCEEGEEGNLLSEEGWERLVDTCKHWSQAQSEGVGFWSALMEVGVSYKCVLALLYCMMERSKLRAVDRICAVHAAHVYLILLQLPSTGGHKLFHPMIFQKALNIFYLIQDDGGTSKSKSKGQGPKGGRGRRKRKAPVEEEEEISQDNLMDTLDHIEVAMETGGEEAVERLLKVVLRSLYSCLLCQSLSEYEVSRYQLIQVLLHLTKKQVSPDTSLILGVPAQENQVCPIGHNAPLCVLAWGCLEVLCRPLHGPPDVITSEIFRQLLPSLLMLSEDGAVVASNPLPSSLVRSSKHALSFVDHVIHSTEGQVHGSLIKLIQHICTKIPDRAEYRNKMAVVVSTLLSLLPDPLYSDMLDWLYKFSRNKKIVYRVFALDVVNELVQLPTRKPSADAVAAEAMGRLSYKFLVHMILSRCSDKAPSVRGRALSCLATAASSRSQELVETVQRGVFPPSVVSTTSSQEGGLIVEMLHRRTTDDKVGVRKSGLQALEAIVLMDKSSTRSSDLVVLHERCLDPSLTVRKQAITSLTNILLDRKEHKKTQNYWLDGVLPMVMDKEPGGEEKCLQLLQEVILDKIVPLNQSTGAESRLAWQLLSLVAEENNLDLQRHLRRAIGKWSRAGKLTRPLLSAVCSHVESEENLNACWLLLSELSQFCKSVETKFVYTQWERHKNSQSSSPLVQILTLIGHLAGSISKIAVEDIKEDIIQLLKGFKLAPAVIQAAVNTLCLICSALTSKQDYQSSVDAWCVPLLKTCEEYISNLIRKRDELKKEEAELEICTYLFTLGEVAQFCPSHTSHHLCLMVQSILLASSKPSPTPPPSDSLPASQGGFSLPSSQEAWPSSQRTLSLLAGLEGCVLSPSLRAHAYITQGKLCLQNEELAKKSVVQMGRELLTSEHPVVRNNIVVILCDLAVRYSTKVDPYISTISSCLKDECLLIRRQTLTLLARLLQEDYIKWRGSLFFHFISTLVDPDMKKFAEFCLIHLLQVRHPDMFYRHFVECVFFFNGYKKHKVYNQFKQTHREQQLFSLEGRKNAEKRMTIYSFLLSNMTDEHRFQLTAKLCHEVIGGLVDGVIPLDEEGVDVIKDTLAILASKEIKLTTMRRNIGEELAEEGDQVGAAVAKARTKIISHMVKLNVMENVLPIIIAAKHLFEKEHDPLLKDLMIYLKELMQDYRSEVDELLAADTQLAQEIQFDLKRFDEEQRRAVQTPPTSVTPHALMMSSLLSPGVLGPVSVMATPPKLKTPARSRKLLATPPPTVKASFRLPVGVSPLVVLQKLPRAPHPSSSHTPRTSGGHAPNMSTPRQSNRTPIVSPHQDTGAQDGGIQDMDIRDTENQNQDAEDRNRDTENQNQDISSPEAARARVNAVSEGYGIIKTPATTAMSVKRVAVTLQRKVLLSAAHKAGKISRVLAAPGSPVLSDNTIVDGRLASTPEGLGEAISFHVSSLLPPSPIPAASVLRHPPHRGMPRGTHPDASAPSEVRGEEGRKRSKRLKMAGEAGGGHVDLLMPSPEAESRPLQKWGVQLRQKVK